MAVSGGVPAEVDSIANESVESFGFAKDVVVETPAAARINTLLWIAENNSMASVKRFSKTRSGQLLLFQEIDKIKAARGLVKAASTAPAADDKLSSLKVRLRELFLLHVMAGDGGGVAASNESPAEIDSGEVKYLLARFGAKGVWGGSLTFPNLTENSSLYCVRQVSFTEVWDWLQLEQIEYEDRKSEGRGPSARVAQSRNGDLYSFEAAAERVNGFKLQKSGSSPLPQRVVVGVGLRLDALEAISSRARGAARRSILGEEGLLGGGGALVFPAALKERLSRIVEFSCLAAVDDVKRLRLKGEAGKALLEDAHARHRARTVEEGTTGGLEGEFRLFGGEQGGGMQRGEVLPFLDYVGVAPDLNERGKWGILDKVMDIYEMGRIAGASEFGPERPPVVSWAAFEKAWGEALADKPNLRLRMKIQTSKALRFVLRKMAANYCDDLEKRTLAFSDARCTLRTHLGGGGTSELMKEREITSGGTSWVNVESVLKKNVY